MLCPCCGSEITIGTSNCGCGARFVGRPLDDPPIRIQRLGPAIGSVLLLVLVGSSILVLSKWLAFGAVLVIWCSWRAVRLARRDPDWYGGYRTAAGTLAIAVLGGVIGGSYGIISIPRYLQERQEQQAAATRAAIYHEWALLEEYRRTYGSYPENAQARRKAIDNPPPLDYWENGISYRSYTEAIAGESVTRTGIAINNFELRSAGADGVFGTQDDIVMRDGIFLTGAEVVPQAPARDTALR